MTTTTINNTKIVLYSSIKELPISRSKAMQNYILQDSGIGNTMQDIDSHLTKSIMFLAASKYDDCKEELTNLRYSFYSMINGVDYKSKAFACLIKQIGDVICDDISTDGLNATVETLTELGTSNEQIETIWDSIKKNLTQN